MLFFNNKFDKQVQKYIYNRKKLTSRTADIRYHEIQREKNTYYERRKHPCR